MRWLPVLLALLPGALLAADAGPSSWERRDGGALLQLTQITPDQGRAFLLNRGFPRDAVETYAAACVFMVIVRNETSVSPVSYRLAEWHVRQAAGSHALKLRQDWLRLWEAKGLPEAARIAFEWSQLPDEQNFDRGDWNQGMASVALPHGTTFDLEYQWHVAGQIHRATLKGVRCADANA